MTCHWLIVVHNFCILSYSRGVTKDTLYLCARHCSVIMSRLVEVVCWHVGLPLLSVLTPKHSRLNQVVLRWTIVHWMWRLDDIHHHSSPPCRASLWHEMLKKRIQGVALLSPILKQSPGGLAILDHRSGVVWMGIWCWHNVSRSNVLNICSRINELNCCAFSLVCNRDVCVGNVPVETCSTEHFFWINSH